MVFAARTEKSKVLKKWKGGQPEEKGQQCQQTSYKEQRKEGSVFRKGGGKGGLRKSSFQKDHFVVRKRGTAASKGNRGPIGKVVFRLKKRTGGPTCSV